MHRENLERTLRLERMPGSLEVRLNQSAVRGHGFRQSLLRLLSLLILEIIFELRTLLEVRPKWEDDLRESEDEPL